MPSQELLWKIASGDLSITNLRSNRELVIEVIGKGQGGRKGGRGKENRREEVYN